MSSRQTSVHWYILITYLQQLANWKRDLNTFTPTTQVQVALNTFQCSQAPKQQNNMELTQCTFHSHSQDFHPERNYLYFGKQNFLAIAVSHIFSKESFFIFQKTKSPKNALCFKQQNFLIFQEELPKPQKPKCFLFLQKHYE